jgi:hypothetical protein
MLTQPVWQDEIFEAVGKLESEFLESPGGDAGSAEAFEDEGMSVLRDPVYRAIYEAVQRQGTDATAESIADELEPLAVRVYEDLRGEPDAVVDAKRSIADALRQLRARSLDARMRQLESLLPLADTFEKDRINVNLKRLADEKRALGVQHWGSVRNRNR